MVEIPKEILNENMYVVKKENGDLSGMGLGSKKSERIFVENVRFEFIDDVAKTNYGFSGNTVNSHQNTFLYMDKVTTKPFIDLEPGDFIYRVGEDGKERQFNILNIVDLNETFTDDDFKKGYGHVRIGLY